MTQMAGRKSKESNDLFYLCSLIDYIARKTHNHRSVVVDALGHQRLQHIFDLADVYHTWICAYLDDYNGSFYYENPQFIFECYDQGAIA